MSISYSIAIDYDDDGNFTDLGDNITSEIMSVEWRLGLDAPYAHISTMATASIMLRNANRDFSPEVNGNIVAKRLRIQSDDGTTIRTHFVGYILRIEPQAGNRGKRLSEIIAVGREFELAQHRVRLPSQTDVRADEAIADILSQINWRYDVLDGMCVIGRDSIGSSNIFPDDPVSTTLDTGKSTFAFLADDWGEGFPANQAIEQLAIGETGRFFFSRSGEAIFHNRHHLLNDDSALADFDDDMVGIVYDYGGVVNDLEVVITPRTIGTANTKLWSLTNALRVEKQDTITIIAAYEIDDEAVGAIDVIVPVASQHYHAYSSPKHQTTDLTEGVQIILREIGSSAAVLEIRNSLNQAVYLTQLDIHGTPLITGDVLSLKVQDRLSVSLYGRHSMKQWLPVITDLDEVESFINWELQRRSEPRGRIRELITHTRDHPIQTLSLTLFDLITIQETQTGHDAEYRIIAEHHKIDRGGTRHQVNWLLEPAESGLFFIIGVHEIGNTDVILAPR